MWWQKVSQCKILCPTFLVCYQLSESSKMAVLFFIFGAASSLEMWIALDLHGSSVHGSHLALTCWAWRSSHTQQLWQRGSPRPDDWPGASPHRQATKCYPLSLLFFLMLPYMNYIFSCSNHMCTIEFSELVAVPSFPVFNVSFLHKVPQSIQWRQMQQWEQEFCWWEWQVKDGGIILE